MVFNADLIYSFQENASILEGYLYDDKGILTDRIYFTASTDDEVAKTEIGRDYFWQHDGYWFRMYAPSSVCADDLTFDVKQVSLEQ